MSEMPIVAYFGYGSLVNRATHRTEIVDAVPARLKGWKRRWTPRTAIPDHPACMLSVRQEPQALLEGLLIFDRLENLPAIDERERNYNRIRISADDLLTTKPIVHECPIYIYEAPRPSDASFGDQRILRSYLDAVLQGYMAEFGETGVRNFIAETEDFGIGFFDDRHEPIYSRPVRLSQREHSLFEDLLGTFDTLVVR